MSKSSCTFKVKEMEQYFLFLILKMIENDRHWVWSFHFWTVFIGSKIKNVDREISFNNNNNNNTCPSFIKKNSNGWNGCSHSSSPFTQMVPNFILFD